MNTLKVIFEQCWTVLLQVLVSLVGQVHWQPPVWVERLKASISRGVEFVRQKPWQALFIALGISALGAIGGYAYHGWQTRPKPVTVDFIVSAPTRTELENKLPPNPLVLSFNRSVAPLALVNQPVIEGITLKPSLVGSWQWISDQQLEFRPKVDWAVGTHYTVQMDNSLVAPGIVLSAWETSFDSAPFSASIAKAEFYQDPLEPTIKKAIFQLTFSHPVDQQALEQYLKLGWHYPSGDSQKQTPLKFTVTYDKLLLNASVQSELLTIPKDSQIVSLHLDTAIHAVNAEARLAAPLNADVTVPGLYSALSIGDVQITTMPNAKSQQVEQLLVITTALPVHEQAMAQALQLWLLPSVNPKDTDTQRKEPYPWRTDEVTPEVLKQSTPLPIDRLPAEQTFTTLHSVRIKAPTKRMLLVKINKPLQAFGGYQLAQPFYTTLSLPDPAVQKALHIMGTGSLLTLSGDKKIAVMARDIAGVKVELGRILPDQLQHLVSQSGGDFSHPAFFSDFGIDNLSERFTLELPLLPVIAGKAHYPVVDLTPYLRDSQGNDKRGIFFVTARDYKPQTNANDAATNEVTPEATDTDEPLEDKRLILITDLGIIAKTEADDTRVVFVQSIHTGLPQVGAQVQLIAKNGLPLAQGITDAMGKVRFAKQDNLVREREPLLYLVSYQSDMSFLPVARSDREVDFSRFAVEGAENVTDPQQLNAYLFSDRGIYRPGDTMNIGLIVKTERWSASLVGLPLEAEILDPRGLTVKRLKLQLAAGGFNDLSYQTLDTAATGNYTVNLYTVKDNQADQQLGSVTVKVEEFEPERMKTVATFSKPATQGWVAPEGLQLNVEVNNLYGAPAQARRVEANLVLKPVLPTFKRFKDYHFHDPHYAKEGFEETLTPQLTDDQGKVSFALDLQKYTRATYQLHGLAKAFEAEGGRSVASIADIMVSDRPFLIGYKADGALDFVAKNAQRNVHVLAIAPNLQPTAAENLSLELVERKMLSVLIKQDDGTYRYESKPKEISVRQQTLVLEKTGFTLPLDSSAPGDYAYLVRDAQGLILSRIDYQVAGEGNVSRSLDRNAELQLTLDKTEYAPGDTITLNIRAPYTGAGLITIERDKVYASAWFKADTHATVQTIQLPPDITGNAYVTVQYSRAPGSEEIFMSPLSYGVAPFKISLAPQTQPLTLTVPSSLKPGQNLPIQLRSTEPTRAVVFAVDEGILQVARYKNPEPLEHFFKKRQLGVATSQILDLILPEFAQLLRSAAAGGDGDNDGDAAFLNPFKRKHEQPAVYWSGIVEVNGEQTFNYTLPETFNGTLRVLAVAVNDGRIGSASQKTVVRGDLIVTPNAPYTLAPGDEFMVSVAVANNLKGSGNAPVNVNLSTPAQLTVLSAPQQTLNISENHEGVVTFRLKAATGAHAVLGNTRLDFTVSMPGAKTSGHTDLSIRPAVPKIASLQFGHFKTSEMVELSRVLYPELREVKAGVSALPLVALPGLSAYLHNFAHNCTEQLISKAMPLLVFIQHPEFAAPETSNREAQWNQLLSVLRARQNAEGGFGLWTASPEAHEFASVYTAHFLEEAQGHNLPVPADMLQKSRDYLQTLSSTPTTDLAALRARAYAIYLLTRQGTITTAQLSSLRDTLQQRYKPEHWQNDLTAVYLAASYQLLQQKTLANALIALPIKQLGHAPDEYQYADYYDPLIHDAQLLYVLAKHFPERLQKLAPEALQTIVRNLQAQQYNTLSAAYLLLAYDAYLSVLPPQYAEQLAISAQDASGKMQTLALAHTLAPQVAVPLGSQRLHFTGPSGMPLYYAISETGYDQNLPQTPISEGLEILRTFLNVEGKPVTQARLGEQLTVQIRLRATQRDTLSNIAVQDMLPGGFEPVMQGLTPIAENQDLAASSETEEETTRWQDRLTSGGNWRPEYTDIREDRVLLYGTITDGFAEYRYQVKATSAGTFNVPPIYAQSLYEKTLQAQNSSGVIKVDAQELRSSP